MKQKVTFLLLLIAFATSVFAQTNTVADTLQELTPVEVVNIQIEAYNSRDMDAFLATYSEDIKIYDETGKLTMDGHEDMRKAYSRLFDNTPNLNCRIENRIIINNKVIDKENVIANDRTLEAVAIYKVENGKITEVRFVK